MATNVSYRDGGKTSEEGLNRPFRKLLTTVGVMSSSDLAVSQRGAGANKSVDIAAGDAFFSYNNYAFYGWNTATLNSSDTVITDNTSGNPRIDAVVAYIDLTVVSSASNDNPGALKFKVVAGTPAGSPSAPSDPTIQSSVGAGNPFIRLANITLANGFTSVVNADITDTRILSVVSTNNADGWNLANQTWTYSSVTGIVGVITVPNDATTKYSVGDSIRFKQGGAYKYFKIIAVTSTTLSITGGSDYMLVNSTITDNYYSKSSSPVGFPGWFNYTPTLGAQGSMTYTSTSINKARFCVNGRLCSLWLDFAGTTGGSADPSITFTFPIAAASVSSQGGPTGAVTIFNTTASTGLLINSSTTVCLVRKLDSSNWGLGAGRGAIVNMNYEI